jgi:hypothetical protein
MREKLLSIGDDYWIEDEEGRRAFRVNGKALIGIRDRFSIDLANGVQLRAKGNFLITNTRSSATARSSPTSPRDGSVLARLWHRDRPEAGRGPSLGGLGLH